jgi:putative ABC transport system permease protein
MASKNIKRNRKRYRITVFSIVISVTLFISFKSFMDMSLNVYRESNESNKMHFSISGYDSDTKIDESTIKKINKLPQVANTYRMYNAENFEAAVDKSKEIKEIKEIGNIYKNVSYKGENKALMNSSVIVYDDNALEAAKGYLKQGTIDIGSLNKENGVIIIGKNSILNPNTRRRFYGPLVNLKPGDEILLQPGEFTEEGNNKYEFGQGKVAKVKVLAVLDGDPFNFRGNQSGLKIITTRDVAERLGSKSINPVGLNIKLKDAKLEKEAKKDIENIIKTSNNLRLINIIDQNRTTAAAILMVKILLYGFVIVVSLIGSVNIINTLTTNIILRRREFAALKSIGLTQRGLRKMISLEGILYGIMGSLYGSVIGTMLSYLLYRGVSDVREQSYKLPLDSILIAAAGAMIIGYLSVLTPVKRMKRDNLIEAVREEY